MRINSRKDGKVKISKVNAEVRQASRGGGQISKRCKTSDRQARGVRQVGETGKQASM